MHRRQFITGLITLVAAPAIVRVASIMPVRVMTPPYFVAYQTLMDGLVAGGVWNKLDALYIFKAPDEETALTNLISGKKTAPWASGRAQPFMRQ